MECKFCESINDRIPVIDSDIDFGILGKSKLGIYIKPHNRSSFISLAMDNYGLGGKTHTKLGQLFYCPMCGRELENKKEEKE